MKSSPCGEKSAASGSGDCVFAVGAGEGVSYRDTSSTGLLGGIVGLTLLAGAYLLDPPRPLDKMGQNNMTTLLRLISVQLIESRNL
ncbi:hypothetical protein MRX96_020744 [Rhipicephalus microplus]